MTRSKGIHRSLPRLLPALLTGLILVPAAIPAAEVGGLVDIEPPAAPRSEKEALLILPGLGSLTEGVDGIARAFGGHGYDLYIPAYIGRDSIDQCVEALDRFYAEQRLGEYRRVHVLGYILGAWTLNRWARQGGGGNIATIVYDRSPLQERAAWVAVRETPRLGRLVFGKILDDLARAPYEPLPRGGRTIGIIVESRATTYIRRHRELALSPGEPDWSPAALGQEHDDLFYTLNDHDAMYHDLSGVVEEVLHFIREGRFSPGAPRARPPLDPFHGGAEIVTTPRPKLLSHSGFRFAFQAGFSGSSFLPLTLPGAHHNLHSTMGDGRQP